MSGAAGPSGLFVGFANEPGIKYRHTTSFQLLLAYFKGGALWTTEEIFRIKRKSDVVQVTGRNFLITDSC